MKEYFYEKGHLHGSTMLVKELIEKLSEYDENLPVFGTWEGVSGFVNPKNFCIGSYEDFPCLEINVEEY